MSKIFKVRHVPITVQCLFLTQKFDSPLAISYSSALYSPKVEHKEHKEHREHKEHKELKEHKEHKESNSSHDAEKKVTLPR